MGLTDWQLEELAIEHTFFAGEFLTTLFYGVFLGMFISCVPAMLSQFRQRRWLILVVAYVTLVLAAETVFCIDQEYKLNTAYIDHRSYGSENYLGGQRFTINRACPFLLVILSDSFMVWRCWEILGRNRRASLYTALVSFGPIAVTCAFGILSILELGANGAPKTIIPTLTTYNAIYYGVSMGHNFFLSLTILISLLVRRKQLAQEGEGDYAKKFISWQATVIETGAIYTLLSIAVLVVEVALYASPTGILFTIVPFLQPIIRFPILYRITHGKELNQELLHPNVTSSPKAANLLTLLTSKTA